MDILEMTDLELYELGTKKLTEQMGTTYAAQFLQKCKPRDYDYTAERHKWLSDDPDILTMAKQTQAEKVLQAKEESVKVERIAAWRKGLLELTDIEIYEFGFKVLADSLGAYGLLRFITQHFKHLKDDQSISLPQQFLPASDTSVMSNQQMRETDLQD
ncbi:MAG: hypothetical protein OXN27_13525 [Candidatus Poribacteria bacterium]|nr:hypothetical protein [Candidatus Poribacteria bacterium]